MKNIKSTLLFLLLIPLFSFGKVYAAEKIDSFDTNVVINKDGTVDVTENIIYDFSFYQKHGIFRYIPNTKTNTDGTVYKINFSNFSVKGMLGKPVTFITDNNTDQVTLKIGDADKLVSGVNTYRISYKTAGALTYFSDHDELYWNVTGNGWEVPIVYSKTEITLPQEAVASTEMPVDAVCYTGAAKSVEKNCSATVSGNVITVVTNKILAAGDGVTFAVRFAKGIVADLEPTKVEPVKTSWAQSALIAIVSFVSAVLAFLWYVFFPASIIFKWIKEKSNVKAKERIVAAWFESPETLSKRSMTPAETGALVDKDVDHKDISATIIDLAQRGFIKIRIDGKKNVFVDKVKEFSIDANVLDFEKGLLIGLLGTDESVKLKDLSDSDSFYKAIVKFKKDVSQRLSDEKLFKDNILTTQTIYSAVSGFAFMTFNFVLGFVALILGRKSARRTDLGIEKYSEGVSLKNFLVSQDAQINFQSENQMFFEKLLPYATAFGVEKIWAKRFEELKFVQPEWCDGNISNALMLSSITNSLNSGVRSNINNMTSTRSSSGFSSGFSGGSSGGGGGGGGGGSW